MRIKNWKQFQHFKDRRPPWIKLYRELLDDPDWHSLDPKASKMLVMLWLLASENDGNLPEINKLAFRLRMSETDVQREIIKLSHWLEHDDINVISQRYQDDAPETETETETKKRQNPPDGVSVDNWNAFVALRKAKKAPVTESVIKTIESQAKKVNWTLDEALQEMALRGWQGFKAEWVTAKPLPTNGVDPGLQKIKEDAAVAVRMPDNVREMLRSAVKRMP